MTQAPVPEGDPNRSARLAPVSGQPLWHPAWIRRFKDAAQIEEFQTLQYRVAAERALLPMVRFAHDLGLGSERGLTMLTERAILLGVEMAREFVIAAAGPLNTDALRSAALLHTAADPSDATLGRFQAAHGIAEQPGHFGPLSHAALVAALRRSSAPPMQLPSPDLMLDQIVAEAARTGMPGLLHEIRTNPDLSDDPLTSIEPVMD